MILGEFGKSSHQVFEPSSLPEYLVRLSSDLTIKSDRVRAQFLGKLYRNIHNHLKSLPLEGPIEIEKKWSRIYVKGKDPGILPALTDVFGIHGIQPLLLRIPCRWEMILDKAVSLYGPVVSGKSFVVRVRRTGQHHFRSNDLEREVGARLLAHTMSSGSRVDLHRPEVKISLEVRGDDVFFLGQEVPGPCGLPIGVGGRALALVSGGFDSLVAAWCAHKRGLELDFLFFKMDSGPLVESLVCRNLLAFHQRWSTGSRSRMIIVDFKEVVDTIQKHIPPALRQVVLKRMFYRGADYLARQLGHLALVTGENLGQVSSQTLANLVATEHALEQLEINPFPQGKRIPRRPVVLRPLLTFEKDEIIQLSRRIGTYDGSRKVPELCRLSQERPATHVSADKAGSIEKKLSLEPLRMALEQARIVLVRDLKHRVDGVFSQIDVEPIEVMGWNQDDILIDIREEDDYKEYHLPRALHVPSYILESQNAPLRSEESYVIYCQMGLLSRLVAQSLQQKGYRVKSLRNGLEGHRTSVGEFER